jgi:choline-sulfatase
MPTRRDVLKASASAVASRVARARDRQPNLLFLIADDHAGYVLGAAGNRRARTPNLDRLASEGARFARHYCNSPVCTPSRQSILTGQLPHAAGVTVLSTPLDTNRPTIARVLAGSGISTAVIGKMHFNRPGVPGLHGFQTAWTEEVVSRRWQEAVGPARPTPDIRTKPAWRPFRDPARIWLNAEKLPFPRPYQEMRSTWVAAQASHYLEEHRDDRFALWVSFQEPHSPFDFPIEWRDRVRPAHFPVPRVGPEDGGQIPLIFRDLTPADKQGIIAAYYTSVNFLDRNVGVVLDKLRQLNLENDTLVVYMADHGYSLGQHGRFEKHCTYDPALQVPLIFRLPGRIGRRVVNDFTESVDVSLTLFDLLNVPRFDIHHGQSLRPYLEGRRPPRPRDSIFSEYLENEEACVRTNRWKFTQCTGRRKRTDGYETDNPTPGRYFRLYDLKSDPGEFTDVAATHPEVVGELSRLMLERFRSTHPEASAEPPRLATADAIDWYLRPRDAG